MTAYRGDHENLGMWLAQERAYTEQIKELNTLLDRKNEQLAKLKSENRWESLRVFGFVSFVLLLGFAAVGTYYWSGYLEEEVHEQRTEGCKAACYTKARHASAKLLNFTYKAEEGNIEPFTYCYCTLYTPKQGIWSTLLLSKD